ncbi:hypothetical protein CIW50_22645 [Tardiphaga sp. P9-11]|nr:hypothetical protein CIW50_22645 [Tardiphaga sp. P9-11]
MSDQVISSPAKRFPVRATMPLLVSACVYGLLLALGPRLLNDPDSYSHIAIGRWILANGVIPSTDAFSFSMHGGHWLAFEWLSEVIYGAVYEMAGWQGVVALAAAAIALSVGILTRFLLRELAPKPVLITVAAVVALLAPHLLARPHVLALPVMMMWATALVRAMDTRTGPPYWALPLLVLWANLHGSVILALGLIGPAILEVLIRNKLREQPRELLHWLVFAVLAVVASCLTPYGPGTMLMPLTTLGLGDALNWIGEWRPQDFSRIGIFEILLLAGIFALSRGVTLPVVRALVVIGLLHFALAQVRNVDLLAMLAPLYLAAPIGRQFRARAEQGETGSVRSLYIAVVGVMILLTAIASVRDVSPAARNTPQAAVAGAGLTAANRVLNDYSFGGYLIFAGIPTFIDGRGELYGGRFLHRYNSGLSLADLNDFLKLLDDYKIDATLLEPETPAVALLDRLPDWKRVYSDDVAVVHKRQNTAVK